MKQIFTISNQLIALGKRLAMVLTMLLIVGIGQVWGADVTFTANVDKGETSVTKDGITVSMSTMSRTDNYRTYASTDMNVSSETATITKIVITCTGSGTNNYGPGKFSGTGYTYSNSTGTWTGSSSSISLTASAQVRITKIVVTYTAGSGNTGDDNIGGGDSGDGNTGGSGGDGKCTWELVTDASTLKVGDEIVIAASNVNYALSTTQNSNNRSATAITKSNNTITFSEAVQIITLAQGSTTGTLSFFVGSGYLYAASSSKNYMRTQTTLGTNGDWIIGINNGVATIQAQGNYTNNVIRYNPNNGTPIFACYASTSTAGSLPAIYKKICATETTVTLNPNGGSGTMDNVTTENGTLTLSECTFTRDGYTFAGWAISEEGEAIYEDKDVIDNWDANNTTLYAQWTLIEYQITYEGLEGATNGDNPNTYTVESETITFEEPSERVGYTFKGWEPEIIEAGSTGNVTIIATWEKIVLSNNCKWVETEIGEIEPEDEVVVTMTNGVTTWALDQDYYKSGDKYPLATTLEVSGNEITQIYDKIKWNISGNATEGYILYPNGQTNTWLYCTGSSNTIKIGGGSPKHFVIENGYLKSKSKVTTSGLEVDAFLGVSTSTNSWRHYPNTTTSVISGQTLKFYKKTCLMSNEFWIDYELANVTCTNTPPPFASR